MKHCLIILPFLFFACKSATNKETANVIHFDSGFSLYQDTIFVDIKGDMTHAFKYHDKFYVLFEQRVLKYGGRGKRWLCIFSNGNIEKTVDCPKEMRSVYLDFYVKNDSIILKPYMNKQCYYLNAQNYVWEKLEKTDDLIFEDEKFYIYSLDFGEWGGKTWFKDKKTGIEYLIESTTPLINKIDTTYYLTNSFEVIKIENPLQLNKCDDDVTYENIETNRKYHFKYGQPIGFDIIYENVDTLYFDNRTFIYPREINIESSFVWQNKLFHIYNADTVIYIAKIENDTIKPIQKIGEGLNFYNWHYSYRCKNLNGNNELLKFQTKDDKLFGVMDIVDNKIFLLYFMNKAELEPKSIGTERADSIFINRLNLILSDLGNLQLNKVDLEENKWGSFDITPNHKIGIGESYYPNPNKYEIDAYKSYLIQEDSLISNSIRYYATKENDLIRVASIDWEKTDVRNRELEKQIKEVIKKKFFFLENCITQKTGNPVIKEKNKSYTKIVWKTSSGFTIRLENTDKFERIRLIIYKD